MAVLEQNRTVWTGGGNCRNAIVINLGKSAIVFLWWRFCGCWMSAEEKRARETDTRKHFYSTSTVYLSKCVHVYMYVVFMYATQSFYVDRRGPCNWIRIRYDKRSFSFVWISCYGSGCGKERYLWRLLCMDKKLENNVAARFCFNVMLSLNNGIECFDVQVL